MTIATIARTLQALIERIAPRFDEPTEDLRTWLAGAAGLDEMIGRVATFQGPPVLLHGDFWPGNVMWRGKTIAAILDWEDAAVGDALSDLACARVELACAAGVDAAEMFTAAYGAVRPIDEESGGRHLLGVTNAGYMYLYLSPPGAWAANPGYIDDWTFVAAPPFNDEDHDNFNFVTDCANGDIYLVGVGRTGNVGANRINLRLLENAMFNPITDGIPDATISVNHVNKELDCSAVVGTNPTQLDAYCAFNAAGGAYVDENNTLSIYGTEHDNDGENNSVKMMKFSNTWTIP